MKLNVNTQQHDFALFLFKLPKCPECTLANQSLSFSKSPTNFDWDFGRDWSLSLSLYLYLYLYLSLSLLVKPQRPHKYHINQSQLNSFDPSLSLSYFSLFIHPVP